MRRDEFLCEDDKIINKMLKKIKFATLSLYDEDTKSPYTVPLSFFYEDGNFYFHGAKSGRKFQLLKKQSLASISCVKIYSYIPSSFLNNTMIPTQFFFSTYASGKINIVDDLDDKKLILQKLVNKYEDKNMLIQNAHANSVFIAYLSSLKLSAKAKFGQNYKDEIFTQLIKDLKERGKKLDKKTIKLMKYFKQH